jgi:hypothetical protein
VAYSLEFGPFDFFEPQSRKGRKEFGAKGGKESLKGTI